MEASRNRFANHRYTRWVQWPLVLVFLVVGAPVFATPTSTRTPGPFTIGGVVALPDGQPPPLDSMVEGYFCTNRELCLDSPTNLVATTTAPDGGFLLQFEFQASSVAIASVILDGVELRGIAAGSRFAMVDAISEAAVRLLGEVGLQNYDCPRINAVLDKVREANVETDFSGLDLEAAVEVAEAAAADDVIVQMALATLTPTPTLTPYRTPTPTLSPTFRATSTPATCVGDCNADGMVTVDELVKAVDIALGGSPPEACTAYYSTIVPLITDIIVAVNNALEQCAVLPPAADLVPTSVRVFSPAFCGSNAPILEICVANIGQTSAAQFNVSTLMGRLVLQFAWFGDLPPGEEECQTRSYPLSQLDTEFKVDADVEGMVAEGRENNNSATFALGTPPPAPTCTASATPTVVE